MDISVAEGNCGSRKRGRPKSEINLKRKHEKYGDPDPKLIQLNRLQRPCSHNTKSLCCKKVTLADLRKNWNMFYSANGKIDQDITLLSFISANDSQKKQARNYTKSKNISVKYFMKTDFHGMVSVCKEFFCFGMGISKSRVLRVAKLINSGEIPKEKHGGDRLKNKFVAKKKKSSKNFFG